jgi:RND family efflux transporter MFP subunit
VITNASIRLNGRLDLLFSFIQMFLKDHSMKSLLPCVVSLALSLCVLTGCSEEVVEKTFIRLVRTMEVQSFEAIGNRSFPGRAQASREVNLSFRVTGPLIARAVDVGTVVKRGDLIARIDPRDFEVTLRDVQGQLAKAEATSVRTKKDYERLLRIREQDPGATSEAMIDKAQDNFESAKATVKSLQAAEDSAKDQLKYASLKAPFDGTIVATYVENFQYVSAQQKVVRLLDYSNVEMVVNIPESFISSAKYIRTVSVVFDTHPDTAITATIKEIGTEASQSTRTFPVTLSMEQPADFKILAGMAGKTVDIEADFPSDTTLAALEIPLSATFSVGEDGKTWVWIVDPEKEIVHRKEVTMGGLTNNGITILAGLTPGDILVTAGVHYLKEGQQVLLSKMEGE